MEYLEIGHLIQLQKTFNLRVKEYSNEASKSFIKVKFFAGQQSWDIYIDNEYGYFKRDKQLVSIYLVLSALESYQFSEDYLMWCQDNEINAVEVKWLNYYRELNRTYQEIESIIGKIDSFISSYDYEFNAGAFSYLFNHY